MKILGQVKVVENVTCSGIANYYFTSRLLGKSLSVVGYGTSAVQAYEDSNNGYKTRALTRVGVNAAIFGVTFIPYVGVPLSATLGIVEAIYGDELYNQIDK